MTDIVERLRNQVDDGMSIITSDLLEEAADKIEKLRDTPPAPHMGVGREEIARTLYECERRRAEHCQRVLQAASGNECPGAAMEPWEDCKDTFLGDADAILSALPVQGTWRTPEGWKLVPVEPTDVMNEAGEATFSCGYTGTPVSTPHEVYRAMLAAAPSPPTPEQARALTNGERQP